MTEELTFNFTSIPCYEWDESSYLTCELDQSLSLIKETVLYHTQLLDDKRKQLNAEVFSERNSKSKQKDEFETEFFYQQIEHTKRAIDNLQEILYNSSLMSIFSVFEGKMKSLCELIENETSSNLKHTDLKSDKGDFGQFLKYLTIVFGVDTTYSNRYLDIIYKYKTHLSR